MGYSTRTMLEMSAACLLFLAAAASGLWLFQTGSSLADSAYIAGVTQDRTIRQTFTPIAGDGAMSAMEVIHAIAKLEDGDAEIVVDGIRYASPVDLEQWIPAGIPIDARYSVAYERDTEGRMIRCQLRRIP